MLQTAIPGLKHYVTFCHSIVRQQTSYTVELIVAMSFLAHLTGEHPPKQQDQPPQKNSKPTNQRGAPTKVKRWNFSAWPRLSVLLFIQIVPPYSDAYGNKSPCHHKHLSGGTIWMKRRTESRDSYTHWTPKVSPFHLSWEHLVDLLFAFFFGRLVFFFWWVVPSSSLMHKNAIYDCHNRHDELHFFFCSTLLRCDLLAKKVLGRAPFSQHVIIRNWTYLNWSKTKYRK